MKEILGPSVRGLKGKTARNQKDGVQLDVVPGPKHIQDHYQEIILSINIIHVNYKPFLITTSRHIHYHTTSVLSSMKRNIIVLALCMLFKFYQKCEFWITEVFADGQFVVCKHEPAAALQVNLNCVLRMNMSLKLFNRFVQPTKDADVGSIISPSRSSTEDSRLVY